jgi:hypothetical protein
MGNGGDDGGGDGRRSSPPCPPVVAAQRVMDGKRVRVGCAPAPPPPGAGKGRPGLGAGAAACLGAKRADAGGAATILALGCRPRCLFIPPHCQACYLHPLPSAVTSPPLC